MDHLLLSNSSDFQFGPVYTGPLRHFDFTLFFEDTILSIVPAAVFLIAAGPRAIWLARKPKKVATSSLSRMTKLVVLSAFATIQLTVLLARATNSEARTRASISAAALDFAAACALFVLSCFEHSRSVTPSTVIALYLILSVPFDAVRLRTFYLLGGYFSRDIANLSSLSLAIKLTVLVTEAVEKRGILLEPYQDLPPEATSGLYNKSIFWWLNPLLKVGFGRTLRVDDLFNLDEKLASAHVQDRFTRQWTAIKEHHRLSLVLTTLKVLKWQLLVSCLPRLLLSGVRFAQPFLTQATISYVANRNNQKASVGWGLVGAYSLVYFAQAVLTAASNHLLNRCITQLRGGLVSLLYNKTLDLNIVTGDVTASLTLMSSDVQRIVEPLAMIHDTWGGIIDVGLGMYLLYRNLGSVCYAPAVLYVLLAFCTSWVIKVIARFQKRWLNAVQVRISFTAALLHSMRNVKLLGLSAIVKDRVQALREEEIRDYKRFRSIYCFQILVQNGPTTIAPFVTFLAYYLRSKASGHQLDLASAFSVLTILRLVDGPLNILLYSCPQLASSMSCFDRIQQYLLSDSRRDNRLLLNQAYDSRGYWETPIPHGGSIQMGRLSSVTRSPADEALALNNCSFGWKDTGEPTIKDIDLSVQTGSITMIIGPVGCGKSTLLKGILGETFVSSGFVYLRNLSIAFADQEAWIQNGTIRDTICGPSSRGISERHDPWYQEVVDCCGLAEDLRVFPKGDKTIIGSKGISLSGGQKQRLALARAVYSRAQLLILDDVFSGLDNGTEELIFRRLFSRSGPLRRLKTTVIVVTHAVHRLPYADLVVSLDANGRICEQGDYASLINNPGYVHSLDIRFKQEHQTEPEEQIHPAAEAASEEKSPATADVVDEDEESAQNLRRRTGELRTYLQWFQSCGYVSSLLSVIWALLMSSMMQTPGLLVKVFSSSSTTAFVGAFGATTLVAVSANALLGYQVLLNMQPRSAKSLHLHLLESVLNAPLSFFTRTDAGTIINRFSQDMTLVDSDLPFSYADFILLVVSCLIGLGLISASGAGYFAVTLPFVIAALYGIQKYYLRTSRQLRLLDLEEKAPLYSMFTETAAGLASIRAFGWTDQFAERCLELLDQSQRPFYLLSCIQRWLGIVLDLLVAALATVLMVIVVAQRQSIEPGLVGLGLLAMVNLNTNLAGLVKEWTRLETSIGAITRIRDFVRTTESEHREWEVEPMRSSWPENGEVDFAGFGASYGAESDLVLQDISLQIRPGEKLGVCGRSGSGKSSMLASLLHLLEFRAGSIRIDGVDISRVARETVRARLNVIPQEPWWVTTESVRFNMDPWNAALVADGSSGTGRDPRPLNQADRDAAFISALSRCQIWPVIEANGGLDATMTSDFLSHGQRQLFCLARALVRQSKIVVLDEVSASVDVKTDELMQRIIHDEFRESTIIAVAHRLNTIEGGDRVVVLSQGRVVEVGEPQVLLTKQHSRFRELYES
ncbi:hypothetical protein A1O3_02882 [Capronia epimyces CBS 606.96]|uniref:ATPase n=1 Tax=Capronia epimyces CBS 606.96 TaxID=1182542 RepID=W9YJD4_9EURO|nr:uncharacterized protein A1O3_02882 [Capronia epimyces CBS 606.96]EXJ89815.1 hypothetical protein A1O3_02882 [Capronia epimyces CBS 606.96]